MQINSRIDLASSNHFFKHSFFGLNTSNKYWYWSLQISTISISLNVWMFCSAVFRLPKFLLDRTLLLDASRSIVKAANKLLIARETLVKLSRVWRINNLINQKFNWTSNWGWRNFSSSPIICRILVSSPGCVTIGKHDYWFKK